MFKQTHENTKVFNFTLPVMTGLFQNELPLTTTEHLSFCHKSTNITKRATYYRNRTRGKSVCVKAGVKSAVTI